MVILLLFYAGRSEPRLALAWTLWEKLEVSPPQRVSTKHETSQDWMRLSQHASVADCTAVLRAIVRDDERAGSRAVYDEKNGTMAITVHVRNEGAPKNEQHGSSGQDGAATIPATEITKRVRNLECRATQHLQADSWFRRTLRKIGLVD